MESPLAIVVSDAKVSVFESADDPNQNAQDLSASYHEIDGNVSFVLEDGKLQAHQFDKGGAKGKSDQAIFPSFGKFIPMIDDHDVIVLALEALFRKAAGNLPNGLLTGRTCVLILPFQYSGKAYQCAEKTLDAMGLYLLGVIDDKTALCVYLIERMEDIHTRFKSGHLRELIAIDALNKDIALTRAEVAMANDVVRISINDIQREKDLAGSYYRTHPADLNREMARVARSLKESVGSIDDVGFVVLGDEFVTGRVWDALHSQFGGAMRQPGSYTDISPEAQPYLHAAQLFASSFGNPEDKSSGTYRMAHHYSYAKKYLYGLQISSDAVEPLADLRTMSEKEIQSLSLKRKFIVPEATRDVCLNLKAGYGTDVNATFCVEEMIIEKKKDFQGGDLELLIGIDFTSAMQGELSCTATDGSFTKRKRFQISF